MQIEVSTDSPANHQGVKATMTKFCDTLDEALAEYDRQVVKCPKGGCTTMTITLKAYINEPGEQP